MGRIGEDVAESLGAAVLTVAVDDQQFKAGLGRVQNQASESAKAVNSAFQTVGSALAGIGVGVSLGGFLKGSIDAAVELETITRKLSNTLGPQGAGAALSFTRGLSDDLGLSFKTLAGTFGSFTAAATAANVPLEQQKALFGAVAKAAQSLGLSNDEINGSLLALQQVASKGTVQMEELRGQLGERLPIAFSATARGLGVTQQQLIKLVESGKLTSAEFFPALTKGLNELTAGASGLPTAAQNFQKLANAWDQLQTSFGQNLLPGVTVVVKQLTAALEELKVQSISADLRKAFGLRASETDQLAGELDRLGKTLNVNPTQFKNLLSDAIKETGAKPDFFGELNLKGEQFARILERLPQLASDFRARNRDTTGDLNAQAAAAAQLLEQTRLRGIEEQKILDSNLRRGKSNIELEGINARISAAKQLATAEGTGLLQLQNRLAIEEKVRQAKTLQLELNRELAKPVGAGDGKDGTRSNVKLEELQSKQKLLNAEVRQAYADAGASLARNAKDAAEALRGAQLNLQSSLRSGFEFLTPGLQQEQLNRARASIQPLVDRGVIRTGIDVSTPDRLFQVAGFAESLSRSEQELVKAQQENTLALRALTGKNTNVTVVVRDNGTNAVWSEQITQAIS